MSRTKVKNQHFHLELGYRSLRHGVATGKFLGTCHRLSSRSNMGCYDIECGFEAADARDVLLHIQKVHRNGKEVIDWC